jgi:hypothetical protein
MPPVAVAVAIIDIAYPTLSSGVLVATKAIDPGIKPVNSQCEQLVLVRHERRQQIVNPEGTKKPQFLGEPPIFLAI